MRPVESGVALWRSAMFSTAGEVAEQLPVGSVKVLGSLLAYPPTDWAPTNLDQLRHFHLHYGDEILGCARQPTGAFSTPPESELRLGSSQTHWELASGGIRIRFRLASETGSALQALSRR